MGTQLKIGRISKASCTKAFYYFGYERGNNITASMKIFEINNFVDDKKIERKVKVIYFGVVTWVY